MKKSLCELFVVQALLNLFIFLYILSFPNNAGVYEIPKSEIWPIITALILFLVSHSVEYFILKDFLKCKILKGVIYAIEFVFIDLLLVNLYDSSFTYISIISSLNILIVIVSFIIYYTWCKNKMKDTNDTLLPPMWFSFVSYLFYWMIVIIVPICGICLSVFLKILNIGARLAIFLLPSLVITFVLTLFLNMSWNNVVYNYETTLDYKNFDDQIKKYYERKLSLVTINYIRIFEVRYKSLLNYKQCEYILNNLLEVPESIDTGLLMYFDVILFTAISRGELGKYNKTISLLEQRITQGNQKERASLMSLKEKNVLLKELLCDHKANSEILKYYQMSNSNSSFLRLQKSFVLYFYYLINLEDEKANEFEKNIKEAKNLLPTFYELFTRLKNDAYIKEKSCGAVIYKIEDEQIYILLEKMNMGHISIPKGHMEEGEDEVQTAQREIKEETNIDAEIDISFREEIEYSPQPRVLKKVVFFISKFTGGELKAQEEELSDCYFVKDEEAIKELTYDSDKEVVKKALIFIKNKMKEE
ncbi:MAG: bis(5'-nucleosyl)-tetraphosphatase [Bacilli bacterium]